MPHSENSRQTQRKRILNSLKIAGHEEQLKKQNKKFGRTSHQK